MVYVLEVLPEKLQLFMVTNQKEQLVWSSEYTSGTLESSLGALQREHPVSRVRMLLADDLAYMIVSPLTTGMSRPEIRAMLSTRIPEEFAESEWDYKLVQHAQTTKILAFVPVLRVYRPLVLACVKLGIQIETVEPSSLSQIRDPNPRLGIVKKPDIHGSDAHSLTLSAGPAKSSFSRGRLIAIFVIGSIVAVLFFVALGVVILGPRTRPVPVMPTSTPEVIQPVDISRLPILVENASGVATAAGSVTTKLQDAGFLTVRVVETATGSGGMTIRVHASVPAAVSNQVQGLFPQASSEELSSLEYAIVVYIGGAYEQNP